jgi:hypothetical protein
MLQFEYCECGCKGSLSLPIGDTTFWMFNDLKGTLTLRQGHGHSSPSLGTFKSYNHLRKTATIMAWQMVEEERRKLRAVCRQLRDPR